MRWHISSIQLQGVSNEWEVVPTIYQGPSAGPNGPPMPLNLRRNVIQHASASSSLHLPEGTKANEAKALVAEIHPAHGSHGLLGPDARSAAPP
eukprot:Skav206526  [mRNA]  locus=scaffold5046:161739:162017:- [translate_table: standard]